MGEGKTELLSELVRLLEREKGCPVQIRIETADSKSPEFFASFYERPCTVTRVEGLNPVYEHDVSLLEGDYLSMRQLHKRIDGYNALYNDDTTEGSVSQLAVNLASDEAAKGNVQLNRPALSWLSEDLTDADLENVKGLLEKNGVVYLNYLIIVGTDALYARSGRLLPGFNPLGDKIADVSFKLFE